jgi:hypothetical protein
MKLKRYCFVESDESLLYFALSNSFRGKYGRRFADYREKCDNLLGGYHVGITDEP